jgi:hypothetical protein
LSAALLLSLPFFKVFSVDYKYPVHDLVIALFFRLQGFFILNNTDGALRAREQLHYCIALSVLLPKPHCLRARLMFHTRHS